MICLTLPFKVKLEPWRFSLLKKHIITLEIEKESDLYCPYNHEYELDESITDYLLRKAKEKGRDEGLLIRICSKEPVDEARVREAFDRWIKSVELQLKKESRANAVKQAWMFCVGIFFVGLSLILERYIEAILFTVLSTIGSFAIWEASSIWIIENPKLRFTKLTAKIWKKSAEFEFIEIK